MIWDILLILMVSVAVYGFVISWKRNVVSKKTKSANLKEFFFDDNDYDDEYQKTKPSVFASDFKNLDAHVSGAVRYNQSMYYNQEEFKKIKDEVLSNEFPM